MIPGEIELVKAVEYDLEPLFGKIPYYIFLGKATTLKLCIVWWPKGIDPNNIENESRSWYMEIAFPQLLTEPIYRDHIVDIAGQHLMMYRDKEPPAPGHGLIPNSIIDSALIRSYQRRPKHIQEKFAAKWNEVNKE